MHADDHSVLDPIQLVRIESTHQGFFYQHLYAVACLLVAVRTAVRTVVVERDEDIELVLDGRRQYLQVKKRAASLTPSDVASTLKRFDELRAAHKRGERSGAAEFWVVANVEPSESLAEAVKTWPSDTGLLTPSASSRRSALPVPQRSLEASLRWCTNQASALPYRAGSAESLVFKLAAEVALACTGIPPRETHRFEASELAQLFNQLVIQLHKFPVAPTPYRPQIDEPPIRSSQPVRLIAALSGAGKTAWASDAVTHTTTPSAYFDVSDLSGAQLATALARDLAGHFLSTDPTGLAEVLDLAQSSGEMLRSVAQRIEAHNLQPILVLDNAHRVDAAAITTLVQAAPSLRWIILAQPQPNQKALEAALGITSESLRGWSLETIAREFHSEGITISAETATRIRRITGGLPLYLRNAARLCRLHQGGDIDAWCASIESATHAMRTTQELVLSRSLEAISPRARTVAGISSLIDVTLRRKEQLVVIATALSCGEGEAATLVRELVSWGVLQLLSDDSIAMHDAFRVLGSEISRGLPEPVVRAARVRLADLLEPSPGRPTDDLNRLRLFFRLLPLIGREGELVDRITSDGEFFYELGLADQTWPHLLEAAGSPNYSTIDRFWARDTLAFWHLQRNEVEAAAAHVAAMEPLLEDSQIGERERGNLISKQMTIAGRTGDLAAARRAYDGTARVSPPYRRILQYNFANLLWRNGLKDEAASIVQQVVVEYFKVLGLRPLMLLQEGLAVRRRLSGRKDWLMNGKWLADCLNLLSMCLGKTPEAAMLRRYAAILFVVTNNQRSIVQVGQEVVDDFLRFGDAEGARTFMERVVLSAVDEWQMVDLIVTVRGHYAVVLAYGGHSDAARAECERLSILALGAPENVREEFDRQRILVARIISGEVSLRS